MTPLPKERCACGVRQGSNRKCSSQKWHAVLALAARRQACHKTLGCQRPQWVLIGHRERTAIGFAAKWPKHAAMMAAAEPEVLTFTCNAVGSFVLGSRYAEREATYLKCRAWTSSVQQQASDSREHVDMAWYRNFEPSRRDLVDMTAQHAWAPAHRS